MREENNNKKKIIIKSFNYKWQQFLIIYGIINIFIFYCCFNSGINEIFPEFFGGNWFEDMEGLAGALKLFMFPLQLAALMLFTVLLIIPIAIIFIFEVVLILIFRFGYFRSEVKDEEKILLSHYIKNALLCFLLAYFLCVILFGDIRHIVCYAFMYLPVPLFTFIFIYLKVKNNKEENTIRTKWRIPLIFLSVIIIIIISIIGICSCVVFRLLLP